MMYNCKNCQHKVDGDCPCTSPGTCDFTEKKAIADVVKPVDAQLVVEQWQLEHLGKYESAQKANADLARHIHQYAESYHAKKCAECSRKERKYYPFGQEPNKTYCETCTEFSACAAIQAGMFCEGKNYKPIV